MPGRDVQGALKRLGASEIASRAFGDFHLVRFRTRPGAAPGPRRGQGFDGFLACATLRQVEATIDGGAVEIARGDVALLDLGALSHVATQAPALWIAMAIPRASLVDRLAGPPLLPPIIISRTIVSIAYVRACLLSLWRSPVPMTDDAIGETAVDMLMTAIDQTVASAARSPPHPIRQLLEVSRILRDGLGDPDFNARRLAERSGLTEREFSALIAPLTPTNLIRRSRLVVARRMLKSGADAQLSVAEISGRVGIHNLAHFTTSYGAAFGAAPSRMRRSC